MDRNTAMKNLIVFLALAWGSTTFAQINPPLTTVPFVDVNQYLGTWYQIARNPLPFEPVDCVCAQQKLGLTDHGTVSVYNSCNLLTPAGKIYEISGEATNNDPQTNAQFTVDFNLPQKGQYWIIGLDPQYRYAVVSDPSKRSLYILSKTPLLADDLYQEALSKAAAQVPIDRVKVTPQLGCLYP